MLFLLHREETELQTQYKESAMCLSLLGLVECHRLGWLMNDRKLFLMALEAEKFKISVVTVSFSGEGPLPGSQVAVFLLCPLRVGGTS